MVREPLGDIRVTWTDGRQMIVEQFRCIGCMALEMVDRDKHDPDHKPTPGRYSPNDGVRRVVRIERR